MGVVSEPQCGILVQRSVSLRVLSVETLNRPTGILSAYRGSQQFPRQSENLNKPTGIIFSLGGE